jgi:hypothetical protein
VALPCGEVFTDIEADKGIGYRQEVSVPLTILKEFELARFSWEFVWA